MFHLVECPKCKGTGKVHCNYRKSINCYDCSSPVYIDYMVKDSVWRDAWPTYVQDRSELVKKYEGTVESFRAHLILCYGCLERRLGRHLNPVDFDFSLPIKESIALGMSMVTRQTES
jgi:hypothetical protein